MKSSPIKLNSKSKSKINISRSPSVVGKSSRVQNESNMSPLHTLGPKLSPNRHKKIVSNFGGNSIPQPKNGVVLRSGSPMSKLAPCDSLQKSQNMENSKSFHQLLSSQISPIPRSPQKSFFIQSPSLADESRMSIMMSPTTKVVNDHSRMVIELGRKTIGVNELLPTQRIVSPAKIIYKPSVRQVQLERKVKILQMRINQLYSEKNMIQTQLNQANIRLQYENNMLKEKLNQHTSKKQQKPFEEIAQCQSCKQVQKDCEQISQKLIKDLQKSQEHEYHQTKQIHSLKQQLTETEQMLSQQISKSLTFMDELKSKEQENQQLKVIINELKEQNQRLENDMKSMQQQFHEVEQQSIQLMKEIETLRTQDSEVHVTKQLMNDLQQNNQLLISAIHQLQNSLKQSHNRIQTLTQEKQNLQNKLMSIEQSHQSWIEKDTYTLEQIEQLTEKIVEVQNELNEKNAQLEEKEKLINDQQVKIQQLTNNSSHDQHEGNCSTAGSFYQKKSCDPCNKCEQLRRTVIRLNSHLNGK